MSLSHLKRPKPQPPAATPPEPAAPPAAADGPAPPQGGSGTAKPKQPKEPKATLTRACGHKQGLRALETTECSGCQAKRRRERKAAKLAKREAGKATAKAEDQWRFPPGTSGVCRWDGTNWVIHLQFPGVDGFPVVEATGIEAAWRLAKDRYLELTAAG